MTLINGTTVEVLNFEKILVSYLAGSYEVFFFIAMIIFAYLGARYRMPSLIFFILMGLFIIIMANYYSLLFSVAIFLIGMFFYYTLSKK